MRQGLLATKIKCVEEFCGVAVRINDCRLWVPVLTIISILLFNMLIVKKYIGSTLLSDGTHIKHRGEQQSIGITAHYQ